ncbi:MAG: co-chaperone YbbN [Pseudomonadota bacterium]
MIELGGGNASGQAPGGAAGGVVKDTTDQTFVPDVIDASRERPMIAYFTAAWCGPCKTLGPQLEAAVAATNGKVGLAKIDVDQNQMVAAQLRVQSIPAVFAFDQGQPVDAFSGAVPQSQIQEFVNKLAKGAGASGLEEAMDAADQMLEEGAAGDAAETFAAVLGEDPENARAIGGLVRALLAAGDLPRAKAMMDQIPADLFNEPHIAAARAAVELAEQAADAGPTAELRSKLSADANDHQTRFELAVALSAAGENEEAVSELLELFRRDREWNDGAAKTQLFTIFDALGPKDPIALTGRRRLSSMIFA